jgi:ribosomal protein S18 acetylase RimI-like enzyme
MGFWRAWYRLSPNYRQTPWGCIITDRRYPLIYDANHAAVFADHDRTTPQEIRAALHPELRAARAPFEHVVFWDPPEPCVALQGFRAQADQTGQIVAMVSEEPPAIDPPGDIEVREMAPSDEEFWAAYRPTRQMFGETFAQDVLEQLDERERALLIPAGMRLFAAFVDGRIAGMVNLLSLAGVGYLDTVVTLPEFRRRGVATAAVLRAVRESHEAGDPIVHLLADEAGEARRLYHRLGFRVRARSQSTTRRLAPGAGYCGMKST